MSFYENFIGENSFAPMCYKLIGLRMNEFGRPRDAYVLKENDEWLVGIFTRTGGSNRAQYQDIIDRVRKTDGFVRDFDDPEDSTYCHFIFKAEFPGYVLAKFNENEAQFLMSSPTEKFRIAEKKLRAHANKVTGRADA